MFEKQVLVFSYSALAIFDSSVDLGVLYGCLVGFMLVFLDLLEQQHYTLVYQLTILMNNNW